MVCTDVMYCRTGELALSMVMVVRVRAAVEVAASSGRPDSASRTASAAPGPLAGAQRAWRALPD